MRLAEVVAEYERRRIEAERIGAAAPSLAKVYDAVIDDLNGIDGKGVPPTMVDCNTTAFHLGVTPTTVARWAKAGRFDGAAKTSGKAGEWRIPLASVTLVKAQPKTTKKLWRPAS